MSEGEAFREKGRKRGCAGQSETRERRSRDLDSLPLPPLTFLFGEKKSKQKKSKQKKSQYKGPESNAVLRQAGFNTKISKTLDPCFHMDDG
jgi:hypothetical protein